MRVPSHDDLLQAFRKAGFPSLKPIQEKLIPPALRGKDVIAACPPGSGSTTAYVAALALGLRGATPVAQAAILVPDFAEVTAIERAFGRFSRALRDVPSFMPLGELEDERREQRRLEKGATIVAGTGERVIDHIRRGSLPIADLKTIVMVEPGPEARAEFVKDVQFIYTKLPERPQTILITRAALPEGDELAALLHHPVSVGDAETVPPAAEHVALSLDASPRDLALARVILGRRLPPVVVVHGARTDARRLGQALEDRGLRVLATAGGRQQGDRRDALAAFSRRETDVLFVPWGQGGIAAGLDEIAPTHVVLFDLPAGPLKQGATGVPRGASLIALVERGQERELTRLQEALGVSFSTRDLPNDDEVLIGTIDRILTRMRDEDPSELGRLRSKIRRQ
ncbi:MAG TPA: DEAD/DEAH box helicase, partial [Spirochaetia bacterium]